MKTNLDNIFKTSDELEKNGRWFEINETTAFLLRPYSKTNPRAKAAMTNYYKPFARQVEMGTLPQSKALEIQIKMFIDVCLVDWKGVVIDGADAKCDKEIALAYFKHLPDLFNALESYASDFNNYRDEVGNS